MKKLNLADFKLKMTKDKVADEILLEKLMGETQATCHDDRVAPSIGQPPPIF